MKDIGKQFTIKDDKYGAPTTYLGANIEKFQLDDGSYAWSMTSKHYVQRAEPYRDSIGPLGRRWSRI